MRFSIKPKSEPAVGTERIKTFFAWWPVEAGWEIRWLEKVTVLQKRCHRSYESFETYWSNLEFIDNLTTDSK